MSVIFLGDIHFLIHSSKLILKTILTRERCSTANPRLRCMLPAWHEITAKTKKGNRQQFVSYLYHLLGNFCNATTFGEMDSLDPLPRHPRAKPSCSNRMTEPAAGSAQVASTSGLGATKKGYCVKKNSLNAVFKLCQLTEAAKGMSSGPRKCHGVIWDHKL